ncbi:E3 ubiquitin-protein ligase RNF13 isoform X2 [Cucumis melo var. makuwa]|uniref:E3 ubiquitin-protein ligase RNF13 isoform X2 n=2 Tax=Cucumis melo TaxID=3656 RepID=A0A5D3B8D7_CUCMM|nr:E3 ubiquitin-protein ligase RNF13 isoform X2 [Cucumis melo var. makuwa]
MSSSGISSQSSQLTDAVQGLVLSDQSDKDRRVMTTSSGISIQSAEISDAVQEQVTCHQLEMGKKVEIQGTGHGSHDGACAICLNKIALQETALVRGCEHAYCATCILRWASYTQKPTCPQCKHPFEFLIVHRSLDGSIHDYMFEESVCLLLRASWYKPLIFEEREETYDEPEDDQYYHYEDDDEELEDAYLGESPSLRIGNRRWGYNGYVRAGRQEARPVLRQEFTGGPSSSRDPVTKQASKDKTGRRAKRALKREAADKAAAAKHQEHLARFGRK